MEKKSAGVGDESKWEEFIDFVGVPPQQRKEKAAASTSSPENSSDQLLRAMIIQNPAEYTVIPNFLVGYISKSTVNNDATTGAVQSPYFL